jgi:hypothetical protein
MHGEIRSSTCGTIRRAFSLPHGRRAGTCESVRTSIMVGRGSRRARGGAFISRGCDRKIEALLTGFIAQVWLGNHRAGEVVTARCGSNPARADPFQKDILRAPRSSPYHDGRSPHACNEQAESASNGYKSKPI